jgi:hypothetical protein
MNAPAAACPALLYALSARDMLASAARALNGVPLDREHHLALVDTLADAGLNLGRCASHLAQGLALHPGPAGDA